MTRNDLISRRSVLGSGLAVAGLIAAPAIVRAQGSKMPITIANAAGGVTLTLLELLKRNQFMENLGLQPTYVNVADTSKIIGSLIGGDVDVCMLAGFGTVLTAVEKGAKLKVIAGAGTLAPNSLFTAKPEIKTLKDLEGRTVGTGSPGAILHQVVVAALQKHGVDPKKVTFANVGTTTDIFKAIVAGTVDAGPCNVDVYGVAEKNKLHSIGDMWKLLPEYPYQGSFATDAAIKNKREALVRTLAAHAKLYRLVSAPDSKAAYMDAYKAATNGDPEQGALYWQFVSDNKSYAVNLAIPDERITLMQQINVQTGVQQKMVPNTDVADMSLAAEALKLLG